MSKSFEIKTEESLTGVLDLQPQRILPFPYDMSESQFEQDKTKRLELLATIIGTITKGLVEAELVGDSGYESPKKKLTDRLMQAIDAYHNLALIQFIHHEQPPKLNNGEILYKQEVIDQLQEAGDEMLDVLIEVARGHLPHISTVDHLRDKWKRIYRGELPGRFA